MVGMPTRLIDAVIAQCGGRQSLPHHAWRYESAVETVQFADLVAGR
jgi:hypothetical protein